MSDSMRLGFATKVLVDFTSPAGPAATHVRGGLIIGLVDLLRDMKEDQRFLAHVPERVQDVVRYSVANTWVSARDIELVFDALDRTFALASGPDKLGEAFGAKIANSMFSVLLSPFRPAGSSGVLLAAAQADRMWPRIYQGGGLIVTQIGPKDLRVEVFGLSFARARTFQVIHGAFIRGMFLTLVKVCSVRSGPSRSGRRDAHAIDVRWV